MTNYLKCLQDEIGNYIGYLMNHHNLEISIHYASDFLHFPSAFPVIGRYNYHRNPYCFYIKNIKKMNNLCLCYQDRLFVKCMNEKCFIEECHAGVRQYVHRVKLGQNIAGFICAGGYATSTSCSECDGQYESCLLDKIPPIDLLDTLISPLALMLSEFLSKGTNIIPDDSYRKMIVAVEKNHSITLDELSKELGYSPSYISHTFKKKFGKTLRAYCNTLKIKDAELLIESTDLSVTDIALSSGFNDLSYFINVFRAETGMSPLEWRREYKNKRAAE